jgi:phytoene dehydrogenase-like protein
MDVIIIGAGLAGLCCTRTLHQAGIPFLRLEASDGAGGRVRTDLVDGFLLNRSFQVLQTAYPEARLVLNYGALDLKPFYPRALVYFGGRLHRVGDPLRHVSGGMRVFLFQNSIRGLIGFAASRNAGVAKEGEV